MVSMVANVNMNQLQEWEEDLSEQTVSKNDFSSQALDAFSRLT